MSSVSTDKTAVSVWNVPNALTGARFVLAVVVFGLIAYDAYLTAFLCFVVAAGTDWIDGKWARHYGQITKFGRIFDPFVDKIIICGAFIALVGVEASGIAPWMAIVVVGRELLVTSLRGLVEGAGGDFSARSLGKWKMVLQCVAVGVALLCLYTQSAFNWLIVLRFVAVWSAILLTIFSGVDYVRIAAFALRDPDPASALRNESSDAAQS
jgi:CDP-diacylglycerol--glycerol-3-phosphate 3-phosphatidyltransferase